MRAYSFLILLLACQPSFAGAQETGPLDPGGQQADTTPTADGLLDLNLEQLSNVDVVVPALNEVVTTVTREESTVGRTPAAVFVITPEMIKRSGANSLPEVLRMVPGVQVAKIDANKWAISARGFNARFANKLLVQIDGRAVYDPLYGGVFWDSQDIVLDDIERIEVIRGPGATVWGSNAVNGVINVITRQAKDTQGALVRAGGGSEERQFLTGRYGGGNGDNLHWRTYAKYSDRDGGFNPLGPEVDSWDHARGGFRMDWKPSDDRLFTFQGDAYEGASGATTLPFPFQGVAINDQNRGVNLLSRWTRTIDEDWGYSLQFYYDHAERSSEVFEYTRDTIDVDFQSNYRLCCHNFVWGFGNRFNHDLASAVFLPDERSTNLTSAFVQDEITLQEDFLFLYAGSKFEHNSFTGFEFQPSVRLLLAHSPRASSWASVSRAVRIPTRFDDDALAFGLGNPGPPPVFVDFQGDRSVVSEEMLAYEIGYRAQPADYFTWDIAGFINVYDNVMGLRYDPPVFAFPNVIQSIVRDNVVRGEGYGAELSGTVQLTETWQLYAAYSCVVLDMQGEARSAAAIEGSTPRNQVYLRSSWDVYPDVQFDLIGRYVDRLESQFVPSYLELDARVAWQVRPTLDVAVVGQNLLDSHHLEFNDLNAEYTSTEVDRGVYGVVTWQY